ncbi:MAG: hypothetical protein AAB787_02360 [Patescibacteria group bacterium]
MKRFELALDAEFRLIAHEIESLRERGRRWMEKAEACRLKGDEPQAIQAVIIASSFAQVADTRAKAFLAW